MKIKEVETKEQKGFEPFSIEITFETPEEARLMYHVFNKNGLRDCIFSGKYCEPGEFNKNIIDNFRLRESCELLEIIQNHVDI